ncbi:MAG: Fic family protein [Flavobacteriales bacterium]|nr:Fic family protein [Flavobacteriales bacterium]
MRTYEQTHPWLSFRVDLRKLPPPVWLLLGRAAALSERLGNAPLTPSETERTDLLILAEAVLASAAMDGNTMKPRDVEEHLAGTLKLPAAQQYLQIEVDNLLKATRWTQDRIQAGDTQLTPWAIQMFNAQVLKSLPWDDQVHPGEWRLPGQVTAVQGAPAEDVPLLMERLCDWLNGPLFDPEPSEERIPMTLVQAALAHLYLIWINPFGEGNGRTARLLEHQLLLASGLPPRTALLPTIGLDRIRSTYGRLFGQCARTNDPLPFIGHWVRAFVDELELRWRQVEELQRQAAWAAHLDASFDPSTTRNAARQRQLLQDLVAARRPVAPTQIPRLSAALAELYAPLHPKTLQRDLEALTVKGFLTKTASGMQALVGAR